MLVVSYVVDIPGFPLPSTGKCFDVRLQMCVKIPQVDGSAHVQQDLDENFSNENSLRIRCLFFACSLNFLTFVSIFYKVISAVGIFLHKSW
jgi:hypothetical protein